MINKYDKEKTYKLNCLMSNIKDLIELIDPFN